MERSCYVRFGVLRSLLAVLFLTNCNHTRQNAEMPPPSSGLILEGRWHYDSAGAAFYNSRRQFLHQFTEPITSGAVLTIGSGQWNYTGSVRERHTYIQRDNMLVVRRLVDSAVVRVHQAVWENMGAVFGRPDTLLITQLTPQRLVVCDSTMDLDKSLIRVWRYYYSR